MENHCVEVAVSFSRADATKEQLQCWQNSICPKKKIGESLSWSENHSPFPLRNDFSRSIRQCLILTRPFTLLYSLYSFNFSSPFFFFFFFDIPPFFHLPFSYIFHYNSPRRGRVYFRYIYSCRNSSRKFMSSY